MAEVIAVIGLASSLVTFIQVTEKVMRRVREFKRAADHAPRTLEHLYIHQLPLLVELAEQIQVDCEKRTKSTQNITSATARRDQQLTSAVQGLIRQIETLDGLLISWFPGKQGHFHSIKKAVGSFAKDREILAIEQRLETYKTLLTLNFSIPIIDNGISKKPQIASYNVVPRHVSRFVGRGKVLDEISNYHNTGSTGRGHRIVSLQAMGGQGKTQTALEYCHRFLAMNPSARVVWIESYSPAAVLHSFSQIFALMFPSENQHLEQKYKRTAVLQEIASWNDAWLIVYDNYDKPNLFGNIMENFPAGTNGSLLFTTRNAQAAQRLGYYIKLAGMDNDDAVDLLLYRAGYEKTVATTTEATKIVRRLGFLPLAIDQAAAYIKARRLPLSEFWDHFNSRKEKVLSEVPAANWEYRRTLSESEVEGEAEKSLSVFTTWELSLSEYKAGSAEYESIDKFLTLASVFDSSAISELLFKHATERFYGEEALIDGANYWLEAFLTNGKWDKFAFQDVVAQCYELSLLQTFFIDGSCTKFTLHPLIADWLRLRKSSEASWQILQSAATMITSYIVHHADSDQAMCNRYPFDFKTSWEIVSYIDDCLRNETAILENGSENKSLDAASLEAFASMYWAVDKFYDARKLQKRAVELHNAERGQDDPLTLVATHSLGELQSHLDELNHAEELFNKVLAQRKRSLGSTDRNLLETQYHLGVIHRRRGDYGPAIEAFRACVATVDTSNVDPHRALDWYASLGGALARTSQVNEAETLLQKAMKMCIEAELQHKVEYLWPMNWLTRLLCVLDRTAEARIILGETHANVIDYYGPMSWEACFVNEIAGVIAWKTEKFDQAKEILQACLEIYKQKYDNFEVDEILGVTYVLGEVSLVQEHLEEARRLLSSAADGYERMCGVGTPTALESLGALLEVATQQRDNITLEQTLTRIELTLGRTFDRSAPFVLEVNVRMCHAHLFLEKPEVARMYLGTAVTGFTAVLGADHKRTRTVSAEMDRLDKQLALLKTS